MSRPSTLLHRFALCLIALGAPLAHAADDSWAHAPYELGQGLQFPGQGLDIGGYLNLQVDKLQHRTSAFNLSDLSLFVNKRIGTRWNLFTEMELGDALSISGDGHTRADPEFDIERLYADYRASPAVTVRLGKFLTPVGRWNMIHADPLVWTVSRPLTTTAAFARHATGAMLYGTLPAMGHDLDYWVFADDTADLDPQERQELAFESTDPDLAITNNFNQGAGGRLLYHLLGDQLGIGASYLHADMGEPQQEKNLFGVDVYWNTRFVELSGEAIYRTTEDLSKSDERGGFIQAVVQLHPQLYLVGRHERYRASVLSTRPNINTVGITYRPRPPISFKLEYRAGDHNEQVAPDGLLGSLSILF